jgi:tartrate-resistant acid phosphatase type 5
MRQWTVLFLMLLAPLACKNPSSPPPATQPVQPAQVSPPQPDHPPVVAQWQPRPYPRNEVNLIAMGDWGNGKPIQKTVAQNMARYVAATHEQFNGAVLAGDNFYVGLKGVDDYQWQSVFEDMYDAKILNFPFYATLGNHDFEGDKARIEREYAQRHPESRWRYPADWYRLDFPLDKPLVTVLMLNSNKQRLNLNQWQDQIRWIDDQLSHAAPWTVAVAHHPLFSNGAHGDNGVLQVEWGSIFKKHNLSFYICGHDHDLQQLEINGYTTTFILAGGGGQGLTSMRMDKRGPFSRKLFGFSHLQIFPDHAVIRYINGADGALVHEFERDLAGNVSVIATTGLDKATTKPLRAIEGFSEDEENGDIPKPEESKK